jgi:hypothetical protein
MKESFAGLVTRAGIEAPSGRSWRSSHPVRSVSSNWNAEVSITAGVYITGRKSSPSSVDPVMGHYGHRAMTVRMVFV